VLDIHALSSGGGTSLTAIATILAGGDLATVAGVPVAGGAALVRWGGLTTIADTIKELKLVSQDQLDPVNGQDIVAGGTASGIMDIAEYLKFANGARNPSMAQNTGAANNIAYLIDNYGGGAVTQHEYYGVDGKNWQGSTVYGGALTAITWKQQAFNPGSAIPAGKYAIRGAWVSSLTNYALLRFRHADFGAFAPGFPVVDVNQTVARANIAGLGQDLLNDYSGLQFSYLSKLLRVPCEPIFTVQANATGLNFEMAAITTDTPEVILNLVKVS
jgi:hypothetical protein